MFLLFSFALANPPLSESEYTTLLETWESKTPSAVWRDLQRLTPAQAMELDIWSGAGGVLWARACTAPEADRRVLSWPAGQGWTCVQVLQQHQNTARFVPDPNAYGRTQVAEVLTVRRCASGAIDAATCGVWLNTKGAMNTSLQKTGDAIVEMGTSPPCTQWFDAGGAYLGCW